MIRDNINYLLVILMMGLMPIAHGQNNSLPEEKVEILKAYKADIIDAKSIDLHPVIPNKDENTDMGYEYTISPSKVDLLYEDHILKPLPLYQGLPPKDHHIFIRAGYGTPNSPLVDATANWRNADNTFGIYVNGLHHSANRKSLEHQRFANTEVNFNSDYLTDNGLQLKGGFSYGARDIYLFGYDHESESFSLDDSKRNLNRVNVQLSLQNSPTANASINYGLSGGYTKINDDLGLGENQILLDAFANKSLSGDIQVGSKLQGLFVNSKTEVLSDLTNVQFLPYVDLTKGILNLHIGANLTSNRKVRLYPDVDVSAKVSSMLTLMAGWKGGLKSNTYDDLLQRNPYMSPDRTELISANYNEIYAGVKGDYQGLMYEVRGGYESIDQLPLFLNSDSRLFDAIYDDGTILRASVSIRKSLLKQGMIFGSILYNHFNLDNQIHAWHHPNQTAELGSSWQLLQESLTIKGFVSFKNGVKALDDSEETVSLNTLVDLSFKADYMPTEVIGVFGQLNNVLNNKHEAFLHYPGYGFNAYGGILVRF